MYKIFYIWGKWQIKRAGGTLDGEKKKNKRKKRNTKVV
jgi:hypothetical protein